MNGVEQRVRHLAIKTAEKRIDDLELLVAAIDENTASSLKAVQAAFAAVDQWQHDLATSHNKVLDEQVARLDAVRAEQARFVSMTFVQRLRWLFLGR